MTGIVLLGALALGFAGWRIWRRLRFSLHIFQLHGYKITEYAHWIGRRPFDFMVRVSHVLGGSLLLLTYPLSGVVSHRILTTSMLAFWCIFFASSRRYRSDREKKTLAWTNRMRRLSTTAEFLLLIPVAGAGVTVLGAVAADPASTGLVSATRLLLFLLLIADLCAPLAVIAGAVLLEPLEIFFRTGFKRRARRRLLEVPGLTTIGITGSYGKTSVKFIVAEILSQRFQVLATPGSYNTPMGICKVINNDLQPHHQVFVVEMGARHPGDIAELCDLTTPQIGVVTNVGVAHMESMGSTEAIVREKGTLAERVPAGGTVVLNADDRSAAEMAKRTSATVVAVSAAGTDASVSAHDIRYDATGSSFVVRLDDGSEQVFNTRLLGRHNVANILMGIAVGRIFGLRLRLMAHAVGRVAPVEHRLQLRRQGDVTVIDDAFNSNPVGARNAVEILGHFDTGRRVVVTPGMIELGEREEEENRAFGASMASNVDLAVLVGPARTRPIVSGLRSEGFPEERIKVVSSLFEAQDLLREYLAPGDVVLYENDLPDQYDEVG